jgi:NAD(P)-dependent dehydrogenase (short-subunit alcohol dehydrogenase family)
MAMDISGASAIVTGGASGLGEATARLLSQRGAHVVVADLQEDRGNAIADELGGIFVRTDVTNTDNLIEAAEAAKDLGPLRALVACAGIGFVKRTIGRGGDYGAAHTLEDFNRILQVNLLGTFNSIRIAATAMSQTEPLADGERGAIVCTASLAAYDGQIGQAAYSASKGGVVGMTLPIARDLAAVGVRVNTICPGIIDTPIYEMVEDPATFKENLKRDILFPDRLGTSEEFASFALEFLTNSYVNAVSVRLDAGARLGPR